MPSPAESAAAPASIPAPVTLLLLCRDLTKMAALDLASLSQALRDGAGNIRVRSEDEICHDPSAVKRAVQSVGAQRLVLGFCSREYPELEVQAHARKAGLDPLGVQYVDLGRLSSEAAPRRTAKAKLALAAAVARAVAFPGSGPANLKTVLLPLQEKVSRRALFTLPPISYQPVPTIKRGLCTAETGCDQCVGSCTYSAMQRDGDAILIDRDRCQGCGACVAACPQRAVDFPGWSAEELEAELATLLTPDPELPDRAVLFRCRNSRVPAEDGGLAVRVPCLAMVPIAAILQLLARGATAVALSPCSEDCPASQGEAVRGRVDYCRQILRLLGDRPERVQFPADRITGPSQVAAPASTTPHAIPGGAPGRAALLFGRGSAAQAVEALSAPWAAAADLAFEHPHSPLGRARIDPQVCTGCGACAEACPTAALRHRYEGDHVTLTFDPRMCTACGQCLSRCPERAMGAIALVRVTDIGLLAGGPRSVFHDSVARCRRCGEPVAARRVLERLATILGEGNTAEALGRLCPDCRGLPL